MLACSFFHTGASSYIASRLYIEKDEAKGYANPVFCIVCRDHECIDACPVDAIKLQESGDVRIDEDVCNGCRDCVDECRSNIMKFDIDREKSYACDLCDGNPICARVCTPKAIAVD